ncbi:MAG: toast rack family protein [Anaerolineales bacterium]|nr:toast rack family protein [Anaerolineales bacterium]
MFRKLFPAMLILALLVTACDLHISLPITVTTGPTMTDEISVLPPDSSKPVALTLAFGAGTLSLSPGSNALVSGTATYNIPDFKPDVTVTGSSVRVEQGNYKLTSIPDFSKIKNEWELKLGSAPMDLTIEAGAYKAEYELGGLALTNLTVKDGASAVKLTFSAPNKAEMGMLRYETGASNVTLSGLANANFAMLKFNSGAGNYTLDFSGGLMRDASVSVETGVSNMTLVIPAGVPVQLTVESGLSNVNIPEGWAKNGNVYTQTGSGPALTIIVEIGAGNLTISR